MRSRLRTLTLLAVLAIATKASASPCADADAVAAVHALCGALDGGTNAEVRAHVRLPLRLRTIASENAGDPLYRRRTLRTVRALRRAHVCADARFDEATVSAGVLTAPRGQFEVRFTTVARGDRCVVTTIEDR